MHYVSKKIVSDCFLLRVKKKKNSWVEYMSQEEHWLSGQSNVKDAIHAFISFCLDYCMALVSSLYLAYSLHAQNAAARLITR